MITSKICDLSIIIPCHNLENYIYKCLQSILNQITKYNYQIICICDDCTDKTYHIINEVLDGKNFVNIKANVHSCGTSRNIGLEYADGNYIWFVDGDDWILDNNAIELSLNTLYFNNNIDILKFGFDSQGYNYNCNEMVWQYIYKREIIGDIKFRSMQPSEDYVFNSQIFNKNPYIIGIDKKLYFYNFPREGSVMWKSTNGIKEENIELR